MYQESLEICASYKRTVCYSLIDVIGGQCGMDHLVALALKQNIIFGRVMHVCQ